MWLAASPMPGWGPARDSGGGSEETFSSSLLFRHAAFGFRFLSVDEDSTENSGQAPGLVRPVRPRSAGLLALLPGGGSAFRSERAARGNAARCNSLAQGERTSACLPGESG